MNSRERFGVALALGVLGALVRLQVELGTKDDILVCRVGGRGGCRRRAAVLFAHVVELEEVGSQLVPSLVIFLVSVGVAEVAVVVLLAAVAVELVAVVEALIAVVAERMALVRVVVAIAVALVLGELLAVVVLALGGEQLEVRETQLAVEALVGATHVHLELVEGGEAGGRGEARRGVLLRRRVAHVAHVGEQMLVLDAARLVVEADGRCRADSRVALGQRVLFSIAVVDGRCCLVVCGLFNRKQVVEFRDARADVDAFGAEDAHAVLATHRTVDLLAQHAHLDRTPQAHEVHARVVDECVQLV